MKTLCHILITLMLIFTASVAFAQQAHNPTNVQASKPNVIKIGVYVKDLYDFNYIQHFFRVNFWLWFSYKNPALNPVKNTEIVNDRATSKTFGDIDKMSDGSYLAQAQYVSQIKMRWKLGNFPFDSQTLKIFLENVTNDSKYIVYVPDLKNSKIDSDLHARSHGWKITDFKLYSIGKLYETNFGDPGRGYETYSRFVIEIKIKRMGWRRFFQFFSVMYLAMFLSFCVLFIPMESINPRVGLLAGAIFAAFGNKLMIDTTLKVADKLILVDHVLLLTMCYLAFVMVMILIEANLDKYNKHKIAIIVNRLAIISSAIFLPTVNFLLVYNAINAS